MFMPHLYSSWSPAPAPSVSTPAMERPPLPPQLPRAPVARVAPAERSVAIPPHPYSAVRDRVSSVVLHPCPASYRRLKILSTFYLFIVDSIPILGIMEDVGSERQKATPVGSDLFPFFHDEGETMFHKSKLGSYGQRLNADMDGYVPEAGDSPWDFRVDHGTERTHVGGKLTEYGKWWEEEGFPEWRDEAIAQTQRAVADLARWQEKHA